MSGFESLEQLKEWWENLRPAVHEAGHAIACQRLGIEWLIAELNPESTEPGIEVGPATWMKVGTDLEPDAPTTMTTDELLDRATVMMAGMAAEGIVFDGDAPDRHEAVRTRINGAAKDFRDLRNLLTRYGIPDDEFKSFQMQGYAAAYTMLLEEERLLKHAAGFLAASGSLQPRQLGILATMPVTQEDDEEMA